MSGGVKIRDYILDTTYNSNIFHFVVIVGIPNYFLIVNLSLWFL